MQVLLKIGGMSCAACSAGLEKHLKKQPGIIDASVNLVMNNASITYENITIKDIEKYISDIGYTSLGIDNYKEIEKKETNEKIYLIVLIILAILILYISMGHMIGLPQFSFINMKNKPVNFSVLSLILTLPIFFLAKEIFVSGFKNLIHKTPNMDTLISIGVMSAFIYSLWGTISIIMGNISYLESLYYESAVIIILFVKLGKYIDHRSKDKTKEAIKALMQLTPPTAIIKRDDKEISVSIDEIVEYDQVICKPGSKIAVDGIVISGQTYMNESFITGESLPVFKEKGSNVIAGSINYDGSIIYEAKRIGKDTTVSEIVRMVVEATNTKAPIAKLADIISGYFVPIILVLSLISLIFWLLMGKDINYALNIFISVLVIACPCALGLATPLAIVISTGMAAKKGILVKTSTSLENAHKVKTIVFDKTGTLTKGQLVVSKVYNYSTFDDQELLQLVGSVEQHSEHPISKAIIKYLINKGIKLNEVSAFNNIPGYGIEADYDHNKIIIGNRALMDKHKITITTEDEKELMNDGNSLLYISMNNTLIGLIGVKDDIKDNVKHVIKQLYKHNIRVIMLTGDNEKTAKIIADKLGIKEVKANVSPQDKAKVITDLKKEGIVMMVGDGVNDAISLASSDIGVSIATGTDIAVNSADVILMHDDLTKINDLLIISKKTILNIKENLFWAFFYNLVMIPIALGIFTNFGITMNPILAALTMTLSSLTVVINALRLRKMGEKE